MGVLIMELNAIALSSFSVFSLCAYHIMDNLQFAGAECARGLVALVIRITKCIREGSTIPPYSDHLLLSAQHRYLLRCAGKDEWWRLYCMLEDISHWDLLGKMIRTSWRQHLEPGLLWLLHFPDEQNSRAVATAIETILILSPACGRNHVVGLS
jgi:hypothetical protein